MLRFTTNQELAVNRARSAFNARQTAIAAAAGFASGAVSDELVGNAAQIPLDAWRRIDAEGAGIQRDILAVFNRLSAASSTPVSMGDLVSFFPKISDSGEVHVSMDGRSEGNADQAIVKYEGTPVPIFDSFARFGWRQMEVVRKAPGGIETETVGNHQRKVAEKLEDMALNGLSSIVVGGATIYGLRNFPQRNTNTHGFDLNAATGAQWLAAIQKLVNALIGDNAFGRVTIFLNYGDWVYADMNEFTAGYPKTILQRLKEINQVAEFVPCSRVPVSELIGIADIGSGKWGKVLNGMPMTTRPKLRQNPEDDYVIGVLASAATQFKSDFTGNSQIAHITKT